MYRPGDIASFGDDYPRKKDLKDDEGNIIKKGDLTHFIDISDKDVAQEEEQYVPPGRANVRVNNKKTVIS